jgi:ribosomal protein S18 acetylase RimI-like enzyme
MHKFSASHVIVAFLIGAVFQVGCTKSVVQPDQPTQVQSQSKKVARKVELVPMSEEDFKKYLPHAVDSYAADILKSGKYSKSAAQKRAAGDYRENLPVGLKTEGHFLTSIVDQITAEKVGILYFIRSSVDTIFIYDIEIAEGKRGGGYGTATMLALEERAKSEGVTKLELHVFNHNSVAVHLYNKLGYVKTRDSNMGGSYMQKTLMN